MRIRVRLTPRGGADRIEGRRASEDGEMLLVRVRAVPEQGLANAALTRLVAVVAGWPPSSVSLESGSKSRIKVLAVSGEPDRLAAGLALLRAAADG